MKTKEENLVLVARELEDIFLREGWNLAFKPGALKISTDGVYMMVRDNIIDIFARTQAGGYCKKRYLYKIDSAAVDRVLTAWEAAKRFACIVPPTERPRTKAELPPPQVFVPSERRFASMVVYDKMVRECMVLGIVAIKDNLSLSDAHQPCDDVWFKVQILTDDYRSIIILCDGDSFYRVKFSKVTRIDSPILTTLDQEIIKRAIERFCDRCANSYMLGQSN